MNKIFLLFVCFPSVVSLRLANSGQGRLGLKTCDPESYGKNGKWVDSKSKYGYIWDDKDCGILPEFNAKTFCTEKIQCKNMLFVGDSTTGMQYFSFYEHMEWFHNRSSVFSSENVHPEGMLAEGYSREEEFAADCGTPKFVGEPNQRPICKEYCNNPVHMTYIRHDHLNGPQRAAGLDQKTRRACAWRHELPSHPWVVMHTGTHVNDDGGFVKGRGRDKSYLKNEDNVWEKDATDLFSYMKKNHPHGVIWKTAHVGITEGTVKLNPCPNPEAIRNKPMELHEVDGESFDGSWRRFSVLNKVYKQKLHEYLPDATVLDVESLMSMRHDCRSDPIHFEWHSTASPTEMWSRMLQAFIEPLK